MQKLISGQILGLILPLQLRFLFAIPEVEGHTTVASIQIFIDEDQAGLVIRASYIRVGCNGQGLDRERSIFLEPDIHWLTACSLIEVNIHHGETTLLWDGILLMVDACIHLCDPAAHCGGLTVPEVDGFSSRTSTEIFIQPDVALVGKVDVLLE